MFRLFRLGAAVMVEVDEDDVNGPVGRVGPVPVPLPLEEDIILLPIPPLDDDGGGVLRGEMRDVLTRLAVVGAFP